MVNLPTFFFGAICALSLTSQLQASTLNGNDDSETPVIAAARRQFPYVVYIDHAGRQLCTGSILTPLWIVTSRSCAMNVQYPYPDSMVIAGALNLKESHPDTQAIDIQQSHWHFGSFPSGTGVVYDIGLIKLMSPLKFTEAVQPIQIPKIGQKFEGPALTVGWGIYTRPYASPDNSPTGLKYMSNKIITNQECQNIYENLSKNPYIPDAMICTGPLTGFNTSCHGDVGAPLVQNNVLAGIFSTGVDCTPFLKGAPSIYTRVSECLNFIKYYVPDV